MGNVDNPTYRLYSDLAWLWPMWGDPTEYAPYCDHVTQLIRENAKFEAHSLLNIGCGGGKNVFNLKQNFVVTGLDISLAMLDLARKLNPECQFHQADMRDFSLPEQFDAILIDDAICYMTTEEHLRSVFERAYAHLTPGGVMVVGPDYTKETFSQNRARVSHASAAFKPDNIDVVFIENDYDPHPEDCVFEALIVYLIRKDGKLAIEHDIHNMGLFSMEVWRRSLRAVGFEIHETGFREEERDFLDFACVKPN